MKIRLNHLLGRGVVIPFLGEERAGSHHLRILRDDKLSHHSILDQKHLLTIILIVFGKSLIRLVFYPDDELVLVRLEVLIVEK